MPASTVFEGNERFRIVRRLGHGSMGLVFEAFDAVRGEPVALKSLIRLDPAAVYRFKREFRALADIVHPNLVALHELVAEGDHWFFTMELVPGEDFLSHVRPGMASARPPTLSLVPGEPLAAAPPLRATGHTGTLDVARLRHVLPQLALAVHALHEGGKVHRDLKPTNTLVTPAGRLVVLDFGIAQELRPPGHSLSLEEGVVGTVAYMSPEQAVTGAVTPASDWYSVGVMLYEALAGRLPFTGQLFQVLATKQAEDPPPLASLAPDAPPDLAALCDALVARDPAARPPGEEVLRRLGLAHAGGTAPRARGGGSVVGRAPELAALQAAFDAAADGRATVACVHGPSGIGKSTLVRHAAARWQRAGSAVVLAGRCYERELVPYKALDGVVEQLGRHLAALPADALERALPPDLDALMRLFPSLRRVRALEGHRAGLPHDIDPLELRRRGVACLRELLRRLSAARPVVLVVDDLQWGDAAGIAVLEELVRPPDAPRLLVLATFRSEEVAGHPFLPRLLERCGTPGWVACPLDPLSEGEARELVAVLGGDGDGATERILREAAGSPFLVEQLVRYVQDGAGVGHSTGVSLGEMVEARLRPLPAGSRELLALLAVAARPLDQHVAAEAAGLADGEPAARMLLGARLVRSTGAPPRLEPYHDRIRETVAAGVPADAARRMHRRLAEVLEARGLDDPEPLYEHWLEGGDPARARRFAKAAGVKAFSALAFDRAAAFLQRALELPSEDTLDRTEVQAALGDALASAGRGAEAARAYLAAVPGVPAGLQLEYRRRAAEQLLISGHLEEGLAVVREVLAAVGLRLSRTPRHALASLLWRRARLRVRGLRFRERDRGAIPPEVLTRIDICWAVAVGLGLVDNIRAADFQSLHLLLALEAGEPERVARALAVEAGFVATQGAPKKAQTESLLRAAEGLADRIASSHAGALCALIRGIMHYHEGDWLRARDLAQDAERRLLRHGRGVAWELSTAQLYQSYACFFLGDLPELVQRVERFRRLARERGNRFATFIFQSGFGNLSWLIADDPGAAVRAIEEARAEWQQEGFGIPHYLDMVARAHRALYVGDAWPAWEVVTREWPALEGSFLLRIQGIRVNGLQLRARCALAQAAVAMQPGRFLEAAERDAHRILRERMAWSDALAWSVLGMGAVLRDDRALGLERLARAAHLFERAGMRLHAAVARWRAGQVAGGDAGRAAVGASRDWLAAQGVAAPDRFARVVLPEPPAAR